MRAHSINCTMSSAPDMICHPSSDVLTRMSGLWVCIAVPVAFLCLFLLISPRAFSGATLGSDVERDVLEVSPLSKPRGHGGSTSPARQPDHTPRSQPRGTRDTSSLLLSHLVDASNSHNTAPQLAGDRRAESTVDLTLRGDVRTDAAPQVEEGRWRSDESAGVAPVGPSVAEAFNSTMPLQKFVSLEPWIGRGLAEYSELYKFLGCYNSARKREGVFPGLPVDTQDTGPLQPMTLELCWAFCSSYELFAVRMKQCQCGTKEALKGTAVGPVPHVVWCEQDGI